MGPRAAILTGFLLGWMWIPLGPGVVRPVRADDELERHLEDLRQQMKNSAVKNKIPEIK